LPASERSVSNIAKLAELLQGPSDKTHKKPLIFW
jgi:hypothetical protein